MHFDRRAQPLASPVLSKRANRTRKKKFAFSNASLLKVAPRTASRALVHDRQAVTKALGQVLRVHLAAQRLGGAEVLCAL
jgi:hypothetical protein